MTIVSVITECLNRVVLVLTPLQRWHAVRRLNSGFMTERWFILLGVIAIITLMVLFTIVSLNRRRQERKITEHLFAEYSEKKGLNAHERQMLLDIATNTGLKRNESIFTLPTAFERGVDQITQKSIAKQGDKQGGRLRMELSFLREKLGFRKRHSASAVSASVAATTPNNLRSRQIPVGKKLYIRHSKNFSSDDIEATIIKNNDAEITVEFNIPMQITFDQPWRVRYYPGSSVWEFDTSVISCSGNTVALNHSNNIRLINRRRFLRVPVKKPAFIATFPLAKSFVKNSHNRKQKNAATGNRLNNPADVMELPEFIPAVVTELGGPGLRVEAELQVEVGDNVLLIFKLSEKKSPDSIATYINSEYTEEKILEGIGKVKHTRAAENGLSMAVELTGLSDTDVNELIRITNAALISTDNNMLTSGNTMERFMEYAGV